MQDIYWHRVFLSLGPLNLIVSGARGFAGVLQSRSTRVRNNDHLRHHAYLFYWIRSGFNFFEHASYFAGPREYAELFAKSVSEGLSL